MKQYKSEKCYGEYDIAPKIILEGANGWKPILMTPVVIVEDGRDGNGNQQYRQISFFIFFEKEIEPNDER